MLLCLDILGVFLEGFRDVSFSVVRNYQKMPVGVSHVELRIPNRKLEFHPEFLQVEYILSLDGR